MKKTNDGTVVRLISQANLIFFTQISYSCWLDMSNKFIWSFAGPITFAGILNVSMFMMSVKAFCRDKITVSDIASIR